MQTVNFPCGHCGNLMAVGSEFLGQQVRCPHCQQVVVAPSAAPPAAAPAEAEPPLQPGLIETILHPPAPSGDSDDIFSPHEGSDDLFGRSNPPHIEVPPDPLAPTLASEDAARPSEPVPDTTLASTVPYLPPGEPPSPPVNGESTATLPSADNESPWSAGTRTETLPPSLAEAPAAPQLESLPDSAAPPLSTPARRSDEGTPWFLILVFSPLVLYSIVITIFAVLLYVHQRQMELDRRDPFEMMPDDGDNPGTQKGQKLGQVYRYDPKLATLPLPAYLRTTLKQPIQIGDLRITPERVERKRVRVFVEGFEKPEPCIGDSLVLYLTLTNLSMDRAFAPLDNAFDRCWRPGTDLLPPFTQLEAGPHRFYGGPAKWYPAGTRTNRREWVEGRKAFAGDLLQPGETKEHFFVCTDGNDPKVVLTLFGEDKGEKVREPYQGPFLWRIRVRRGRVPIKDRVCSATAVIGVEFTDKDIEDKPRAARGPAQMVQPAPDEFCAAGKEVAGPRPLWLAGTVPNRLN